RRIANVGPRAAAPLPMADKQTESPSSGANRAPWRVEGAPEPSEGDRSPRSAFTPPGGRWFWLVLLALLALNWYVGSRLSPERQRLSGPYTVFPTHVEHGNV